MTDLSTWDDFPVADHDATVGYARVTENGYGMLLAWAAGPGHALRVPARREDYPIVEQTTRISGTSPIVEHRKRTADEQREVDDDIDTYLRNAGIAPHPRGFTWWVRVRPGDTGEDLGRAIGATASVEPAAAAREIRNRYGRYVESSGQGAGRGLP
jgi:hypothetical protein